MHYILIYFNEDDYKYVEFIQDLIIVQKHAMTLNYDPDISITRSYVDVDVRVPGFGETWEVEFLDSPGTFVYDIGYMALLVQDLRNNLGYDNTTLFAAPYDFRLAPSKFTLIASHDLNSILVTFAT